MDQVQRTYGSFRWWRMFAGRPADQARYKRARGVTIIILAQDMFGRWQRARP